MRTIKFRALKDDMSNCRFYYGSLIYGKEGDPKIYDLDTDTYHTCIKGTECQFTGLHDKNGKEIYEGDIVKCGYGIGKVIYHAGCFMIEWIDDKEAMMEFIFSRDGIYSRRHEDEFLEIIGNIHENSELLNQN